MQRFLSLCTLGLLAFSGCSETATYCEFKGAVTADNAPVEDGTITFTPIAAGPGQAPVAADIAAGAYEVTAEKKMTPGKYRVAIIAERATGRKIPTEPGSRETVQSREQFIPPRYNANSELSAEVTAGQSPPLDFNLSLKKR